MSQKLIKVCGMTCGDNIREVEALGVDLMGFIFCPASPRFVRARPDYLPVSCDRVGVFVDETEEVIRERAVEYSLTFIQLHGHESPLLCGRLRVSGFKVIKVFNVASRSDLDGAASFEGVCDYFLFDTVCAGGGGSGRRFDWGVLDSYSGGTPFFLSGGIGLSSLGDISSFCHPLLAGYDLNSRFEVAPGVKDAGLLKEFLKQTGNAKRVSLADSDYGCRY